jgi:SAM-dependent methyltransferase
MNPWLQEIEAALWEELGELLPAQAIKFERLVEAILERSRRYTSERDELSGKAPDPDADLAARALFFTMCDAPKISIPLRELAARGLMPNRPLKVADIGAGALAMTFGLLGEVSSAVDITAIDVDGEIMDVGLSALERTSRKDVRVRLEVARLSEIALPAGSFDFVMLGSVLNEGTLPAAKRLFEHGLGALRPDGALIVIEPALREQTRALHQLRDFVISEKLGHVFAPCTRQIAPCPALADERDWCHEDRPVQLTRRAAQLATRTGLRDSGLKFSYLVLRRDPTPLVETSGQRAWRVVSHSRKLKGKRECFACSDLGRIRMTLLKRNRSDSNREFERADRGDVILTDTQVSDMLSPRSIVERKRS